MTRLATVTLLLPLCTSCSDVDAVGPSWWLTFSCLRAPDEAVAASYVTTFTVGDHGVNYGHLGAADDAADFPYHQSDYLVPAQLTGNVAEWLRLMSPERGAVYADDALATPWREFDGWAGPAPLFGVSVAEHNVPDGVSVWDGSAQLSREGASPQTLELINHLDAFCTEWVNTASFAPVDSGDVGDATGSGAGEGSGS